MLLEAGFFPSMRVSPGYILCHNFVGMLSILLHVDFNCRFILIYDGLCGNCYILCCQVSLQVVLEPGFTRSCHMHE